METVQELSADAQQEPAVGIQRGAYLLELSLDWIVLRASENIHHLLGELHVTLIDEPLGKFVHAQALHDLRNLFSRLSGTMGIGRAYGIRLTDDPDLVDVAFHVSEGRVLFEAVASAGVFGECFGSVGGLISGLAQTQGGALLDNAARRMRALTGYDRVILQCDDQRVESSRGAIGGSSAVDADVPTMITDAEAPVIALFPETTKTPQQPTRCSALAVRKHARSCGRAKSGPVSEFHSKATELKASFAAKAALRAIRASNFTPPPSCSPSYSRCAWKSTG